MADPDVKINFTAEANDVPPVVDRLRQLFDELSANIRRGNGAYEDMRGRVQETADAVQNLLRTAGETGNPEAVRAVEQAFSAGASTVAKYGEEMETLREKMMQMGDSARRVVDTVASGNMSYDVGVAHMEKYAAASAKSASTLEQIGQAQKVAGKELDQARALESTLTKWAELQRVMSSARAEIEAQQQAVRGYLTQLGQLDAALGKNTASYATQAAEIAQARAALVAYGEELQRVEEQLSNHQTALRSAPASGGEPRTAADPQTPAALEREQAALDAILAKLEEIAESTKATAAKRISAHEQAAAAAKREAAAQEQAAARAAAAEKEAARAATAAAQKEAAAQEQAAYAMQLATMKKHELAEETRRLIAERKKAAAVGDTEAYKRLTAQLGQCRTAMRSLQQAAQMNKIAMLQQAQTAASMGSQLQSIGGQIAGLGEAAENGTLNVTGLASGVISLTMAIKAGMGPLGWALLAIQGLQMAWNTYAKEAKAAEERTLKLAEAEEKLTDKLKGVAKAEAERRIAIMKSRWEVEDAAREYAQQIDEASAEASDNQAKAQVESAADAARREISIERSKLEERKKLGQVSNDEYLQGMVNLARREREIAQEAQDKLDAINVEGAKRRADTAGAELQKAKDRLAESEQKFGEKWQYAGDEQVEKLINQIDSIKGHQEELKARVDNVKDAAKINSSLWKDMQKWGGIVAANVNAAISKIRDTHPIEAAKNKIVAEEKGTEKALKNLNNELVSSTKDLNKAYEELAGMLNMSVDDVRKFIGERKIIKSQQNELKAAQRNADVANYQANLAQEEAERKQETNKERNEAEEKTTRSIENAQLAAEALLRARKEELEKVQRTGSLADQKAVLLAHRREMQKGSDEWKRYTAQIRRINAQMREERLSELARTHAPEEVRAELERLRTRCKEGSEAWKRYTDQIRRLEVEGIRDGLEKYKRELDISTTYQKQDTRTQAEIYRADRRKLTALVNRLRRDIDATDDYALRRSLQEELRKTLEQQKNLHSTTAKSAREALKELTQRTQAQKAEAKNGRSQHAMDVANHRYEEAVKRAGRELLRTAQSSGKESRKHANAALKAQQEAKKQSRKMERWAKNPAAVRKQAEADNESIETTKEAIRSKKQAARSTAANSKKERQASDDLTQAKHQQARELRGAHRPAQEAPRRAAADAATSAESARQVTTQLQNLRAQERELGAALSGLQSSISELVGLVGSLAQSVANQSAKTRDDIAKLRQKVEFILNRM